ncbi:BQ5605_C024g09908 [Microbotryum silenes-dioicae]|uniref:BQ5605_C024g09908 protein n=1 Tax=Microbotryum silenes-dioicae TaxID=796604 RepID=A0A2X0MLX2_9BASI|nr:BQ5605_C024g09908 [Microbotryum silenes-dioicae]
MIADDTKGTSRGAALLGSIRNLTSQIPTGVGSFQHTLRQQAASINQHAETVRLHMAIKAQRGVVLDEQALARELALYSKHIYLWGQDENFEQAADVVDISDRLAYVLLASSELNAAHALRVEQARIPLKELRNHQNNEIVPKRREQENLQRRLAAIKDKTSARSTEEAARLQADLYAVELELHSKELEAERLKRTQLHATFGLLFEAQKELGEKQAMIAGYGALLLREFESGFGPHYQGQERTAQIKGELGEALKAWSPDRPLIPLPTLSSGGSRWLGRQETGSLHETHGDQLNAVDPESPATLSAQITPPPVPARRVPHSPPSISEQSFMAVAGATTSSSSSGGAFQQSAIVRSASTSSATRINLSPTPVDLGPHYTPPASPLPTDPITEIEGVPLGPTVAETGTPIVGSGGPITGQLRPRAPSNANTRPVHLKDLGGSAFESSGDVKSPLPEPSSSTQSAAPTLQGTHQDDPKAENGQLPVYSLENNK